MAFWIKRKETLIIPLPDEYDMVKKCTTCGSIVGNIGDEELCIKCDFLLLPEWLQEQLEK